MRIYSFAAVLFFLGGVAFSQVSAPRYEVILALAIMCGALSVLCCFPILKMDGPGKLAGISILVLNFAVLFDSIRRLVFLLSDY